MNIRAITAHFSPKIDAWLSQQQLSTPSEEQILDVVKANYDSLTLKLQVILRMEEILLIIYLKHKILFIYFKRILNIISGFRMR